MIHLLTAYLFTGLATARADGDYWWLKGGAGGAFGGGSGANQGGNNFQQNNPGNNFQGNQGGNVFLGSQGSALQSQGGCPVVTNIPPVEQCSGRSSNCWSVGQPDSDCINNALCCFDGCANVCRGAGSVSPVKPQNPRRPGQSSQNRPVQQQPAFAQQQPAFTQQQKRPGQQQKQPSFVQQQQQKRPGFGLQQQQYPVQQQQYPVQQQQQQRPGQQQNNNFSGQSSNQQQQVQADQKPYTKCPSAMKCIRREYCDFDGVMTNNIIQSTPELEMLRVPLIPCVNRQNSNSIDVCCRDPNYKDPWPNMNNNKPGGSGASNNLGYQQGINPRVG